jgi:hypothetical protein
LGDEGRIPDLTDRQDMADRAVTIHLKTITQEARWPEGKPPPPHIRMRCWITTIFRLNQGLDRLK